jgi:hypothetical protein
MVASGLLTNRRLILHYTMIKKGRRGVTDDDRVDPEVLGFFSANWSPGAIGIVGTDDAIGMVIRRLQGPLVPDGKPSWWDHCFIMGELRRDRRGPKATVAYSPYILESAYGADFPMQENRGGAQENWVGKWCGPEIEHAAVVDFGLTDAEREQVLASALHLASEHVRYSISELIGTWIAIAWRQLALINPMMKTHSMYCSAFVRYCYLRAGHDFITDYVSMTNTTPEHIAAAGLRAGKLKLLR